MCTHERFAIFGDIAGSTERLGWMGVGGWEGGGGWGLRLIHDDATHTYAARYYVVSRSPYLADILLKS